MKTLTNRTNLLRSVSLLLALSIALLGLGLQVTQAQDDVITLDRDDPAMVTYYTHDGDLSAARDPQLAGSTISQRWVDNTFLGLTDLHPETSAVRPEVATEWSASEDGLTWTFTLRDDIPWVHWNPETGEATMMRMITAQDVVTGTRRACNATLGGSYGPVTASFISGCSEVLDSAEPTDELFEGVGVRAIDDQTVEFTLVAQTGFFPSVASLWTLRPVPGEVIDEFGPEWIEPGNAWFSGPFLADSYTAGVGRTLIRNPFLPEDLRGPGNIDRVELVVINDNSTLLSLYLSGQVDMIRAGGIPEGEISSLLDDAELEDELLFITGVGIDYLSFNHGKAPFDDVHVRRAFSAAIDREAIIQDAAGGLGTPMIHITPPSMPGAPPIDEVGVGFNPEWAVEQLAMSPYPGCEGFPEVFSVSQPGRRARYVEFLIQSWSTILGCDPALFTNEVIDDFSNMVPVISINNNMEDRPHWHPIGWGPDYPDSNNWVGDILKCDIDNGFTSRPCSEVDDLIQDARVETDPATRSEMYAQIEDMFFGEEGVYPAAPIRLSANYALYQTYFDGPIETDGQVGGEHWDWYTVDTEGQSAVRGG
jgi:oligopeptide transport system substrate-binding protein